MSSKFLDKTGLDTLWAKIKSTFQTLGNLVTAWGSTPSDTKYPSEKLVKDSLDGKLNIAGDNGTSRGVSTLINQLSPGNSVPSGYDCYVSEVVNGAGSDSSTYHRRPIIYLWEYIKTQISSVLGLTASSYGGKAATAGTTDVASSVNATAGKSITSTGSNGSMEILNGALSSASGGGGSCSIDGDGISFSQGVSGSSMTSSSIATSGTGTFTGGAEAKGRPIDGSATILANASITWNSNTTHLVINRSAASTTTIDLKNLSTGVVYWLHVPRDNIIALKNSSALSTFYCYNSSHTTTSTNDTYNIRSHINGSSHGGFSSAIVRSNNNFYVMMDY